MGLDLKIIEIHPAKNNASVGGRGYQAQTASDGGVQADAFHGNRSRNSGLQLRNHLIVVSILASLVWIEYKVIVFFRLGLVWAKADFQSVACLPHTCGYLWPHSSYGFVEKKDDSMSLRISFAEMDIASIKTDSGVQCVLKDAKTFRRKRPHNYGGIIHLQ
jgi:hypothetical protein